VYLRNLNKLKYKVLSFGKEAIKILFWRAGSILVNLFIGILIARLLGPTVRGEYAVITITISFATLFINFGTPESSIYLIGKSIYSISCVITSLLLHTLYTSLFVCAIIICFYLYKVEDSFYTVYFTNTVMSYSILSIIIQALLSQCRHFLIATKKFDNFNSSILFESIMFLTFIVIFLIAGFLNLTTTLLSYIIGSFAGFLFVVLTNKKLFAIISLRKFRFKIVKHSLSLGVSMFITGLGTFGIHRINFYLLELYHGTKFVGMYSVANTFPTFFENLPQQFSTLIYSFVSNSKDSKYSNSLSAMVLRNTIFISFLFCIPFIFFSGLIVTVLYGNAYVGIETSMIILMLGMTLSGCIGLLYNFLAGSGYPKYGIYLTFLVITTLMICSPFLTKIYGIEGAAVSRSIASLVGFVYIYIIYLIKSKNTVLDTLLIKRIDYFQAKALFYRLINKKNFTL
jgi:O-antigen/teichoic acid export membrane protein